MASLASAERPERRGAWLAAGAAVAVVVVSELLPLSFSFVRLVAYGVWDWAALATPLAAALGIAAVALAVASIRSKARVLGWVVLIGSLLALVTVCGALYVDVSLAAPPLIGENDVTAYGPGRQVRIETGVSARVPAGWIAEALLLDGRPGMVGFSPAKEALPGMDWASDTELLVIPKSSMVPSLAAFPEPAAGRTTVSIPLTHETSVTAQIWRASSGATFTTTPGAVKVRALVVSRTGHAVELDWVLSKTDGMLSPLDDDASLVRHLIQFLSLSVR